MKKEFETVLSDVEVFVVAHLVPPTAPTIRMDPNDSDPGDPGERYIEAVQIKNLKTGKFIDITDCLSEKELEALADEAYTDWMEGE